MPLPDADGLGPGSGRLPPRVRLQTRFLPYFTSLVVAVLPVDAAAGAERAAGAASPAARPAS